MSGRAVNIFIIFMAAATFVPVIRVSADPLIVSVSGLAPSGWSG